MPGKKRQAVITEPTGVGTGPATLTESRGATANATLGQTEYNGPSSTLTKSAVRGASNKKPIYVIKDGSVEPVDQTALAAALNAGWKLVSAGYAKKRSFSLPDVGGASLAKSVDLYVPVVADVTIGFKQAKKVYDAVPAAARTFLGQVTTPGNQDQVVRGGNYFVFATAYGIIPAKTLIPRSALKASVRFSAPTDTTSGVYTSYAKSEPG